MSGRALIVPIKGRNVFWIFLWAEVRNPEYTAPFTWWESPLTPNPASLSFCQLKEFVFRSTAIPYSIQVLYTIFSVLPIYGKSDRGDSDMKE
ncbi:hypothetical protein I7I50_07447 [Histoplasma capsulatum G186AR]|uniref:Uncharacterized protein n=1 Tax=Ajellomyces capsulatus TaxID=5037 RepID=A0A8H7Z108_AJECA|nr:hypothetical protein I7I52_09481 [Histoplasma capsulatum]QSS68145.1 hypothetical protein I7I50_07447 [Histoplasma capsulatum G186AR]